MDSFGRQAEDANTEMNGQYIKRYSGHEYIIGKCPEFFSVHGHFITGIGQFVISPIAKGNFLFTIIKKRGKRNAETGKCK